MQRLKRTILVILAFLAGMAVTRLMERTSGGAEPSPSQTTVEPSTAFAPAAAGE